MSNGRRGYLKVKPYGKINLGLKIVGKRGDGYHNIETILHGVEYYDTIELILTKEKGIKLDTNIPPYGGENICFRAAELFFKESKILPNLWIVLKKNIPIGGGLGGGSSCGAQVLLGVNKLYGKPLRKKEMRKIATHLGMDVLFFLEGGAAFVKGKGDEIERLTPLEVENKVVIIYPNFPISTSWAYSKVGKKGGWDFSPILKAFKKQNIDEIAKLVRNDFEEVVMKEYPIVKQIRENLLREKTIIGGGLTGTGSCIYGIIKKGEEFDAKKFPQCTVKVVKLKS